MTVSIITDPRAELLKHLAAATEYTSAGKLKRWATTGELCAAIGQGLTPRNLRNRMRDAVAAGHSECLPQIKTGQNRYIITAAGRLALERYEEARQAAEAGLRQRGTANRRTGRGTINDADFKRESVKSPARLLVERLCKVAPDHAGHTIADLAALSGLTKEKVRKVATTASNDGALINIGARHWARYVHRETWAKMRQAEAVVRNDPVRNSNQPTGSPDYWRKHMARQNTPARVELTGAPA